MSSSSQIAFRGRPHRVLGNVRRRGRSRWQARVWCAADERPGWVNVGVYETEEAASQVARKVLKTMATAGVVRVTALDVFRTAQKLAAEGWDVCGQLGSLMPKYVCAKDGKYGYRRRGGNGCDRGGYESAEAAHASGKRAAERVAKGKRGMRSGARVTVQMSIYDLIGGHVGANDETAKDRNCASSASIRKTVRRVRRRDNPGQLTFDSLVVDSH